MEITTIESIPTGRQVVSLSGWDDDTPFVCQLKRIGMYQLMETGNIPNPLIPTVRDLFMGMQKAAEHEMSGREEAQVFLSIARMSLDRPTYQELDDAGISLTDQQVLEIFMYATRGPRGLETFRAITRAGAGGDGTDVSRAAKPDRGD